MAFDAQALSEAARCVECLNANQKQNVLLYLLNGILESGGAGGADLHNLLSLTHPDTVPGPPLRGSLIVGNATPDWEALLIGPANRVLRSDGVDVSWSQLVLTTDVTGILPVANGGTGTSTAFTQGSVIFAGVAGVYTQDNANLFFDNTNNRLGIGTAVPLYTLHVLGPGSFQYGFAAGALLLGADLNATTVSVNSRKVGRVNMVSYDGGAINTFLFGGDLQAGTNDIYFGGVTAGSQYAATAIHFFTGATQTTTGGVEKFTVNASGVQLPSTGAAAGNTGELRFLELAASGTNYTGFKAADAMAASEIYVLPDAAPSANRFLRAAAVAGGVSTLSWSQISLTADVTGVLPVANGGSGTSTVFTQGSVIFAGAAGVFAQDNANLFWDDTNNRLGLGTATPNQQLELTGNLRLVATTATTGIIYQDAITFIHTFGSANLFVGVGAGNLTLSGIGNTGIGQSALMSLTTGEFNFGCGFGSMISCTSGIKNVGVGANSLRLTVAGSNNVAIGSEALFNNLTGSSNTAVGTFSLTTVLGFYNVGVGYGTLSTATDADSNIAIGTLAGANITTGDQNIIIGHFTDSPTATNSNTMTIGNLLFGTGIDGTGTTISSGNIGVGVITPLAKFHVINSIAATICSIFKASASQSVNITEWQSSAASVLVCVDEVGNFGVGTAGPLAKVHISGAAAAIAQLMTATDSNVDGTTWAIQSINSGGNALFRIRAVNDAYSAGSNAIVITRSGITVLSTVFDAGNVGIGEPAPLARLHIAAGASAISTAPLKFTTGTSLTTAEAGAMEFTTDDLFFTITTGAARKRLLMADATAGLTSGKIPIATTNGRLVDLTASAAYTVSNVTTDRTIDADSTSLDEVADVLCTLINDLKAIAVLG